MNQKYKMRPDTIEITQEAKRILKEFSEFNIDLICKFKRLKK